MRIFASQHEFGYTWEEVTTCNWRKYCPWNHKGAHVIGVDTLSRTLDPQTNMLRTERLITCKQAAPQWVKTFLGTIDMALVYEVSYVDLHAKKVTMCSQNMTWNDLISVQEKVQYTPSREAGKTSFDQSAKIIALCGGWQKIKNIIEEFSVERFRQNAARGREGFERVLAISREVFAEQKEQKSKEEHRLSS